MKKMQANKMLWLVIGLPVASVLMGIVTIILSIQSSEQKMQLDEVPLSKTSWSESL